MDAQLRALQAGLQSLIDEGKALEAKGIETAEESVRATELAQEIAAKQTEIETHKSLFKAVANADTFLNSKEFASIAAEVDAKRPGGPDEEFKKAANAKLPGRAQFFQKAGLSRDVAAKTAYRFGMFALATAGRPQAVRYCQSNGIPLAGHTEGVNEDGGFTVQPELDEAIIILRELYGLFRQYARYTPMGTEVKDRLRRTGGLTAYFVDEEDSITASKMGWDRVKLVAKKLAVLAYASSELNEDSVIDLGDTLAGEMAYAFAQKEDTCGFVGTGISTHGGIVGVTQRLIDVFTVAPSAGDGLILGTGNLWSELVLGDFHKVSAALPQYAETGDVAWYCHKQFWENVMFKLALAAGGVPAAEIVQGVERRFLGYPVRITQVMASGEANSHVPVFLADLSLAAMFGDRRQTTLAVSEHDRFSTDELAFRGIERFDINVHDVGAAGTPGPVVGLITAAS